MATEELVPSVYRIGLGIVNAFPVRSEGGLTLVDTGSPGSQEKILDGIKAIGREPGEVERIIVTHLHFRLGYAPINEDLDQGKETLRKLAEMAFEVACFGHGGPIRVGAARQFKKKWG